MGVGVGVGVGVVVGAVVGTVVDAGVGTVVGAGVDAVISMNLIPLIVTVGLTVDADETMTDTTSLKSMFGIVNVCNVPLPV